MQHTRYIPLEAMNYKASFTKDFETNKALDYFFTDIYNYYYYKGFYNFVISEFFNMASMLFMLVTIIIITTAIDYNYLFSEYHVFGSFHHPQIGPLSGLFITVYSIYWLYKLHTIVFMARKMYQVRQFYIETLGINDAEIYTVRWNDIMKHLVDNLGGELNEHDIVNFIMRKQNFMIALINKNVLEFTYYIPGVGNVSLFTRLLEYVLKKILYPIIYGNDQCEINSYLLQRGKRPKLIRDLQWKLRVASIGCLVLSPFLLVVLSLYFIFNYAQIFKNAPSAMCSYQWSLYSAWKFREFNELPHTLQYRLKKCFPIAEKYLTNFPFQYRAAIAKFVCFITGTFITILTIFTMVDDQFLFQGVVGGDFNIVFTLTLLGTIYTLFHYFTVADNILNEPEEQMKQIIEYTHYYPDSWRGNLHQYTIRHEFSAFFEFKLTFIINEIMSVISAPYILWFVIAPQSTQIIDFLQDFIKKSDRVGYVCSFATFDLQKHGSAEFGGVKNSNATEYLSTNNYKMESSIMSFKKEYPHWDPNETTKSWMQQTMPGDSLFLGSKNFGESIIQQ